MTSTRTITLLLAAIWCAGLNSRTVEQHPPRLLFIGNPDDAVDDPEGIAFMDSVEVYHHNQETGETASSGHLLDAGHVVRLRTEPNSKGVAFPVVHTIGDRQYYQIATDKDNLYIEKQDVDGRAYYLRDQFKGDDMLRDALATVAPDGKSVTGYTIDPDMCHSPACKVEVPDGHDLRVITSDFYGAKDEGGELGLKNFLLVQDRVTGKRFWLPAEMTGMPYNDEGEVCDTRPNLEKNADDILDSANKLQSDLADQLLQHVGACFEKSDKKPIYEVGRNGYVKTVVPSFKKKSYKVNGQTVSREQMIAIDLMSRTIYGEMASCNRFGSQYLEAVGKVIVNRRKYIRENPELAPEFISNSKAHHQAGGDFGDIILHKNAFSLWNPGDPAGINAFCPENPTRAPLHETPNGKRKHFQPAVQAYRKAVEIAAQAVLAPDQFRSEMKHARGQVMPLFYTSSMAQSSKGFVELTGVQSGSADLGRKSCMRIWASKDIRKKADPLKWGSQQPEKVRTARFAR